MKLVLCRDIGAPPVSPGLTKGSSVRTEETPASARLSDEMLPAAETSWITPKSVGGPVRFCVRRWNGAMHHATMTRPHPDSEEAKANAVVTGSGCREAKRNQAGADTRNTKRPSIRCGQGRGVASSYARLDLSEPLCIADAETVHVVRNQRCKLFATLHVVTSR